jgi:hypothetical protein
MVVNNNPIQNGNMASITTTGEVDAPNNMTFGGLSVMTLLLVLVGVWILNEVLS